MPINIDEVWPKQEFEAAKWDVNPKLPPDKAAIVKTLIYQFRYAFACKARSIGFSRSHPGCKIELKEDAIGFISTRPIRQSPKQTQAMELKMKQMLEQGIVAECDHSDFISNMFMVEKANPKHPYDMRPVVDYQKLNDQCLTDHFPIPRLDDVFMDVGKSVWYTIVDFIDSFFNLAIKDKEHQRRTAFRVIFGIFMYLRLPQGYKNSPAVFQRHVARLFTSLMHKCATNYYDDLITYSKTFEEHLLDVISVLFIIVQDNMVLSPKKARFFYNEVQVLGRMIGVEGVWAIESRIKAILALPQPKSITALRSLLGMAGQYRTSIPNYAELIAPLTDLLKKGVDVAELQSPLAIDTVNRLKEALSSTPVLAYPDFNLPFRLITDASRIGIGAILEQDQDGANRIILCISRVLSKSEKLYSATEIEMLAVHWALQQLYVYLDGPKFELHTDHSALKQMFDLKTSNRRLRKWALELSPYRENMAIIHRPGIENGAADCLSRLFSDEQDDTEINEEAYFLLKETEINLHYLVSRQYLQFVNVDCDDLRDEIVRQYDSCSQFGPIVKKLAAGQDQNSLFSNFRLLDDGLLLMIDKSGHAKICVPEGMREKLLAEAHDSKFSAHIGVYKMLTTLNKLYYWKTIVKDVQSHCEKCKQCARMKYTTTRMSGQLTPTGVPPVRWHTIAMDFTGPFSRPNDPKPKYVLVVVDCLSKRCHLIQVSHDATAKQVADLFVIHIFKYHGLPKKIISDRDPKFTATFWECLMENLGTKLALSTARHPQSDGQSERSIRTIQQLLRCTYQEESGRDWEILLALVEFAYNNSVHSSTGFCPFELENGMNPLSPLQFLQLNSVLLTKSPSVDEFINSIHLKLARAQENLMNLNDALVSKDPIANQRFHRGDLVMVSNRLLKQTNPNVAQKLQPRYYGPFEVLEVISPNAYVINLPPWFRHHRTINIEYLKMFQELSIGNTSVGQQVEEQVEVEAIIASRLTAEKQKEYLVRFKGGIKDDDTWVSEGLLKNSCPELLQKFLSTPKLRFPSQRVYIQRRGEMLDALTVCQVMKIEALASDW